MYGLVNRAIEDLVVGNHGEAMWEAIKAGAGVDEDVFISNQPYPDDLTCRLGGAAAHDLDTPAGRILVALGEWCVLNTAGRGCGPLMKSCGRTPGEFLANLPDFPTRMAMIYPALEPPIFQCAEATPDGLHLRSFTRRPGLTAFVTALIPGLGRLRRPPCSSSVMQRKDQGAEHNGFAVTWGESTPA